MDEVLRMKNRKQYQDARALIRNLCANYDRVTGGCLLLDRGEVVECPQRVSLSLVCRYFRDVLLEDKEAAELKDSILGEDHRKECAVCGQHFRAVSNRAKYCRRCSEKVKREQAKARKQKQRSVVTL